MWQDLVDKKDEWIGGELVDYGDSTLQYIISAGMINTDTYPAKTKIVDFKLTDKWFGVVGADFSCGGSRECVGILPHHVENGLAIGGYGGHEFHIIKPDKVHALEGQAFMEIHCFECQLYEQFDCPGITPKTIKDGGLPLVM